MQFMGGLSIPDLRMYYLAFEMAKIARYGQAVEDKTAWMEVENEICSPFLSSITKKH